MLTAAITLGQRLIAEVLDPMKASFVDKDEIIDLLGIALVGRENLFLHGPPGTAKSALVRDLGRRLGGTTFEYLLTRFTEPSELFGPFDIRRLREGELVTNTEGMLPEANLVFLDELLNANSSILNGLLGVLNERVLRRGREVLRLPLVTAISASNHLPEDEALGALFDRFLLRVPCENVEADQLEEVLGAGWNMERDADCDGPSFGLYELSELGAALPGVDLGPVRPALAELVTAIRRTGISLSDRRAVKMQRVVAASALLAGRGSATASDLWVFRYAWETAEQREILCAVVGSALRDVPMETAHPRAATESVADPVALMGELESIRSQVDSGEADPGAQTAALDGLARLSARAQWVKDSVQRESLLDSIDSLRGSLGRDQGSDA